MVRTTLITGIVLILLGVPFFLGQFASEDGKVSWTPFIPGIFGLVLVGAAGLAAARPGWRMHVMHAAMVVGLLVALAGLGMGLSALLGGELERPAAAIEQLIMGLVGAAYVGLGVKSFVDARRARTAETSSQDVSQT